MGGGNAIRAVHAVRTGTAETTWRDDDTMSNDLVNADAFFVWSGGSEGR